MSFLNYKELPYQRRRLGITALGYGIFLTVHPQWVQLTWGALDE